MERLQKVLAAAGIASRRASEALITAGRVRVNGEVVRTLGTRVDPSRDAIKVDGKRIPPAPAVRTYLLMNKPRGVVTTLKDPEGRRTVADLLPKIGARVFPVGRLDYNSEGLLILTDDGDLAQLLTHPTHGVEKTYAVKVRGRPNEGAVRRLLTGVNLDGRRAKAIRAKMTRPGPNSWLELTVHEGRKHLVRRMLEGVGYRVLRLRRTEYGGVRLGALPAGAVRRLSERELGALRGAGRSP